MKSKIEKALSEAKEASPWAWQWMEDIQRFIDDAQDLEIAIHPVEVTRETARP